MAGAPDEIFRNHEDTIRELSPTACVAKWAHSLIIFHQGRTHSCMYPRSHPIIDGEMRENPAALANTKYKLRQREAMLDGKKPPECAYCWYLEDEKEDGLSDRVWSSTQFREYARKHLYGKSRDELLSSTIPPDMLEVAFSPTCLLKCIYCSPEHSSSWVKEVKEHGPITIPKDGEPESRFNLDSMREAGVLPISHRERKELLETFWKWWEDIKDEIRTFRLTGGEPLLEKETYRIMERIVEDGNRIEFSVNTSLMVPEDKFSDFVDRLRKIDNAIVFLSCEGTGKIQEYVRFGLDYEKFRKRVATLLDETNARISFSMTNNVLSIFTMPEFYNDCNEWRHQHPDRYIGISFPCLKHPEFLHVGLLRDHHRKDIFDRIETAYENALNTVGERVKGDRRGIDSLKVIMNRKPDNDGMLRRQLAAFLDQIDKRRNTNIKSILPEIEEIADYDETFL